MHRLFLTNAGVIIGKHQAFFLVGDNTNKGIEFDSQMITAGTYIYNLVIDGKQIDSKKMNVLKD